MKIEKGHYVPKELITSEAIYKLVVMCFEAAGGKVKNEVGQYFGVNSLICKGLGLYSKNIIVWYDNQKDNIDEKPLTLQELLTAENSIQWPEWADEIRLNDEGNRPFFKGLNYWRFVDSSDMRSSNGPTPPYTVLATRKPAEEKIKIINDGFIIGGDAGSSGLVTTDNVSKEVDTSNKTIPENCNLVYIEEHKTIFLKVHEHGEITLADDNTTLVKTLENGRVYKVSDYKALIKKQENVNKAIALATEIIDSINNMSVHELMLFKNNYYIYRLIKKLNKAPD